MPDLTIPLPSGARLVCEPGEDYIWGGAISILDPDGRELYHWTADEWKEDPELTIGAVFAVAAKSLDELRRRLYPNKTLNPTATAENYSDVFRHEVTIIVLSENDTLEKALGDEWNLSDLDQAMDTGDCLGTYLVTLSERIPKTDLKRQMLEVGNDGSFFDSLDGDNDKVDRVEELLKDVRCENPDRAAASELRGIYPNIGHDADCPYRLKGECNCVKSELVSLFERFGWTTP